MITDRDGTLIDKIHYLGKNKNWVNEIKSKKEVVDFISYLNNNYDLVCIGLTNQSGIARGYYNCKTVEEINSYLSALLKDKGISIDIWKYAQSVDPNYLKIHPTIKIKKEFVKTKSGRKPNTDLVIEAAKDLNLNLKSFDYHLVLGDDVVDKELAENLNYKFIDVKNKTYKDLVSEFLV